MAIASPPVTASNADLVRWAMERVSAHDLASLRQLMTDETVERFPDRTCVGPDEIVRYFEELTAALPDLRMDVVSIAEHGDDVLVRWRLTGTHRGRLEGVSGTGRPVSIDGMDHFVVRDGRFVSVFVVSDRMQAAQQIGVLPPDGSPAERAAKRAFNAKTALLRRLRG